jgi:hypothetical protein
VTDAATEQQFADLKRKISSQFLCQRLRVALSPQTDIESSFKPVIDGQVWEMLFNCNVRKKEDVNFETEVTLVPVNCIVIDAVTREISDIVEVPSGTMIATLGKTHLHFILVENNL